MSKLLRCSRETLRKKLDLCSLLFTVGNNQSNDRTDAGRHGKRKLEKVEERRYRLPRRRSDRREVKKPQTSQDQGRNEGDGSG